MENKLEVQIANDQKNSLVQAHQLYATNIIRDGYHIHIGEVLPIGSRGSSYNTIKSS